MLRKPSPQRKLVRGGRAAGYRSAGGWEDGSGAAIPSGDALSRGQAPAMPLWTRSQIGSKFFP
jgi:hypothetical protein